MRFASLAVVSVLFVACGPPLSGPYECTGLTLKVYGDYPLNCDVMKRNIEAARTILEERGIADRERFDALYTGLPVLVTNYIYISKVNDDESKAGWYSAPEGILLAYNAQVLLHEMLHHLDFKSGAPATYFHYGWDKNGFNDAADAHEKLSKSPSFDNKGPLTIPVEP